MEVKGITLDWYEKSNTYENELQYAYELLEVDKNLAECDNILSEVGLQIGYSRYERQIYEIAEKRQHLCDFVMALPDYMELHLDEPLRKNLNHGACETISRIHMADFQVENTLGIQVQVDTRGYADARLSKDMLTLKDFLGNAIGENANTGIPNLNGRTCECVEEFASIFQQQYDRMFAMGMLGDDFRELEDYLDQFAYLGEYDHKEEQPFYKVLLSNVLDLTIVKPIIESCCGYDLITGEDLTEMERNMKVVGALVDLVTLATGLYGFSTAAKSMGWKEAASYFGQLALVELASDVSATTVATIGNYCDWPMGVTLLLSLGTGLTVGQVGNHLIFERNGIEVFRKEVSENGELFDETINEIPNTNTYSGDFMSPEEATRYSEYWRELGIGSDKTWKEFIEANPNATIDDYFEIVQGQSPWPIGYEPKEISLETGDTFEMALGVGQPPTMPGRFATSTGNIVDVDYVRNDLAVKVDWKPEIDRVAVYQVKEGVSIPGLQGPVGPQVDLNSNVYLHGGADQINILLDRSENAMDYFDIISVRPVLGGGLE